MDYISTFTFLRERILSTSLHNFSQPCLESQRQPGSCSLTDQTPQKLLIARSLRRSSVQSLESVSLACAGCSHCFSPGRTGRCNHCLAREHSHSAWRGHNHHHSPLRPQPGWKSGAHICPKIEMDARRRLIEQILVSSLHLCKFAVALSSRAPAIAALLELGRP